MHGPDDAAAAGPDRLADLLAPGVGRPGWVGRLGRVCTAAVAEMGVDGAGVTVMASVADGLAGYRDQLCATDALARRLEDLQLTTGEGPCLDAFRAGAPVLVADLAADPSRWLGFGPEAVAAGAAAVFSMPLQVGAVRLGTLDLHRTVAKALSPEQLAVGLDLASSATEILLELPVDPLPDRPGADARRRPAPRRRRAGSRACTPRCTGPPG